MQLQGSFHCYPCDDANCRHYVVHIKVLRMRFNFNELPEVFQCVLKLKQEKFNDVFFVEWKWMFHAFCSLWHLTIAKHERSEKNLVSKYSVKLNFSHQNTSKTLAYEWYLHHKSSNANEGRAFCKLLLEILYAFFCCTSHNYSFLLRSM